MSKLYQELCKGFPGLDIAAVKEWRNERGEMGVYHETSDGELYEASSYVIAILVDGHLFHETLSHHYNKSLIEDAEIIALFAGAQE